MEGVSDVDCQTEFWFGKKPEQFLKSGSIASAGMEEWVARHIFDQHVGGQVAWLRLTVRLDWTLPSGNWLDRALAGSVQRQWDGKSAP